MAEAFDVATLVAKIDAKHAERGALEFQRAAERAEKAAKRVADALKKDIERGAAGALKSFRASTAATSALKQSLAELERMSTRAAPSLKGESLATLRDRARTSAAALKGVKAEAAALAAELKGIDFSKLSTSRKIDFATQAKDVGKRYREAFREASGAAKEFEGRIRATATATSGLKTALAGVGVALTAHGLMSLGRQLVEVNANYQATEASIRVFAGGQIEAARAMEQIKKLAVETPFTLDEVARAWSRLKGAGLSTSDATIKAFGDIAASNPSRSIVDFVEAVADATMGQQIRLLDFGIKMEDLGEKVKLTFKDTTLVVKDSKKEIEQALFEIAQKNFGGLMEAQSKTLKGSISRLSDAWQQLLVKVGEGGLNDAIQGFVDSLAEMTQGSGEGARALGELLGDGVKVLTELMKFLVEHIDEVKAALAAWLAVQASSWVRDFAGGIGETLSGLAEVAKLAGKNPYVAIGVAAVAAITAILVYKDELAAMWDPVGAAIDRVKEKIEALPMAVVVQLLQDRVVAERTGARQHGKIASGFEGKNKYLDPLFEGADSTLKNKGASKALKAASKEVDHYAKALKDLTFQASEAARALYAFESTGGDPRQMAIETKFLETKNALLREGKTLSKEQAAAVREQIEGIVGAELALKRLERVTGLLKDAQDDLAVAQKEIALAGKSPAEKAIELKMFEVELSLMREGIKLTEEETEAFKALLTQIQNAKAQLGIERGPSGPNLGAELTAGAAAASLEGLKGRDIEAETLEALSPAEKALDRWIRKNLDVWTNLAEGGIAAIDQLADRWFEFLETGKFDFKAFVQDILAGLNEILVKAAVAGLAKEVVPLFGGSSVIGGSVLHAGGIVGQTLAPMRMVPAGIFAGAPRYHSGGFAGLRPGEYPAILEEGERVIPKDQARASGGDTISVSVFIQGDGGGSRNGMNYAARQAEQGAYRGIERALRGRSR